MTRHTLYILFISILLSGFSSCSDDDFGDDTIGATKENCDVLLGDFTIDPNSRNSSSVEQFSELLFINELEEEKIFTISESVFLNNEETFTEGDSTIFCYNIESYTTTLTSEEGLEFMIVMEVKPYFPDVESKSNADVLKIFYNDTRNTKVDRRLVFRKVLNMKDYPAPLYSSTVLVGEKAFIDASFLNVELTEFNTPIIRLYYNDSMSIVAFEDELNVLWQLKESR